MMSLVDYTRNIHHPLLGRTQTWRLNKSDSCYFHKILFFILIVYFRENYYQNIKSGQHIILWASSSKYIDRKY